MKKRLVQGVPHRMLLIKKEIQGRKRDRGTIGMSSPYCAPSRGTTQGEEKVTSGSGMINKIELGLPKHCKLNLCVKL
ncbi:hypothetical protein HPP92_006296 [Vanilla planifolia]|uniref:Uncharacterized protein n=1 Tax=Vanilla planifolia TaxID=51239 RepID=A0A835S178_VANPL|nr:hypothetical protein HPP92_006296 [Vanilla planifolia]